MPPRLGLGPLWRQSLRRLRKMAFTDRKVIRFADLATECRRKPRHITDDEDQRTHRRTLTAYVKRIKRRALQTKDEDARLDAVQVLCAMVLVKHLAEHDLGAA